MVRERKPFVKSRRERMRCKDAVMDLIRPKGEVGDGGWTEK